MKIKDLPEGKLAVIIDSGNFLGRCVYRDEKGIRVITANYNCLTVGKSMNKKNISIVGDFQPFCVSQMDEVPYSLCKQNYSRED